MKSVQWVTPNRPIISVIDNRYRDGGDIEGDGEMKDDSEIEGDGEIIAVEVCCGMFRRKVKIHDCKLICTMLTISNATD